MQVFKTNCTIKDSNSCHIELSELLSLKNLFAIILAVSLFGVISNSICIHFLANSKHTQKLNYHNRSGLQYTKKYFLTQVLIWSAKIYQNKRIEFLFQVNDSTILLKF